MEKTLKQIPSADSKTFLLDFTDSATPAQQLLQVIPEMRRAIIQCRLNKALPQTLTYSVKCSGINVQAIQGHLGLCPIGARILDPAKFMICTTPIKDFPQANTIVMTISVNDLNPSSLGYTLYMSSPTLCYHVSINEVPYTLIGFGYRKKSSPFSPPLTDLLGILVTEQIRFNTLEVSFNTFPEQVRSLKTKELHFYLFSSFKESVYNNWQKPWKKDDGTLRKLADNMKQDSSKRLKTFKRRPKEELNVKEEDQESKEKEEESNKKEMEEESQKMDQEKKEEQEADQIVQKQQTNKQGENLHKRIAPKANNKVLQEDKKQDYQELKQVQARLGSRVEMVVVEKVIKCKK